MALHRPQDVQPTPTEGRSMTDLRERASETHRAIAVNKAVKAAAAAEQVARLLELRAYDDALRVSSEVVDWIESSRLNTIRAKEQRRAA